MEAEGGCKRCPGIDYALFMSQFQKRGEKQAERKREKERDCLMHVHVHRYVMLECVLNFRRTITKMIQYKENIYQIKQENV